MPRIRSQEYYREQDRLKSERDKIWIENAKKEMRRDVFEKSVEVGGINLLSEMLGQHPYSEVYLYSHQLNDLKRIKADLLAKYREKSEGGRTNLDGQ